MATVNEVMFSRINQRRPERWGFVVGVFNRRIIWFEKGERLGYYDADFTSVSYHGDLPEGLTTKNCRDYRLVRGQIIYDPGDHSL